MIDARIKSILTYLTYPVSLGFVEATNLSKDPPQAEKQEILFVVPMGIEIRSIFEDPPLVEKLKIIQLEPIYF